MGTNIKSLREFHQSIQARGLLAALNLTDVVMVEVRPFCQALNAHSRPVAVSANGCADYFSIFLLRRHENQPKQEQK